MKETRILLVLGLLAVALSKSAPSAEAALPGKNGPIVFARKVFGPSFSGTGFEIFRARRDGTNPQRLTINALSDTDPAWSPDGTQIVFERKDAEVYVMDAEGGNQEFIVQGFEGGAAPAWSPNGTSIAFIDTSGHVATLDLGDPNAKPVTVAEPPPNTPSDYEWFPSDPSWSPDGQRIAFTAEEDVSANLEIVDADGSSHRRITLSYFIQGLDWSPSGHRLAISMRGAYPRGQAQEVNAWELYTMNPDASHPKKSVRRITNNPYDAATGKRREYDPVWSPNGSKLIFSGHRDGDDYELVSVNAAFWKRPHPKQLTDNDVDDIDPGWRSDNN